jgi:two-component system sensor kinase FixL
LNCLFGLSDIVERAAGSLDQVFREVVELLALSWDHSDVACARVVLGETEVRSQSYGVPVATQATDIVVRGETAGTIEVSYTETRPPRDEGPFTVEEGRLLRAVAERVGHIVERLETEEYLRRREDEFRRKMAHLARVNTMGELASNIAHEINQPLTAIATYAQACRRLVHGGIIEDDGTLEILDRIGEEALRAGEIIRRLRSLVQKRDANLEECDVMDLLREVDTLASVDARLNGVQLNVVAPETVPLVLSDRVQIQQVLLNLARNGIDAMEDMPASRRILEIRVEAFQDGEIQLSVIDRGSGLPEVSDEELFEPFFSTKPHGLGVGLSISRSIVQSHGGRLWYSKNRHGGTTFSFTLPTCVESNGS